MPKRRIIFYTDCFILGGCERAILDLIASQRFCEEYDYLLSYRFSKDYQAGMRTLAYDIPKENIRKVYLPDIHSWHYGLEKNIANSFLRNSLKKLESLLFRILMPVLFLYEFVYFLFLFHRSKADAVHINNGGYPGALSCCIASLAAKCIGYKQIFFSVHNMAKRNKFIYDAFIDFCVKRSRPILVTASLATAEALVNNRGFDKSKIVNIYYGTKEPAVKNIDKKMHISMVGRFEERKGHRYAILAFKKLLSEHREYKDLKFLLMGEGPLLIKMKNLVAAEKIQGNVEFLGHVNKCIEYVASSLFLINPSLNYESLPYSILEAMSVGTPVIGTAVAGIPEEIKDGITGIIVPPADIPSIYKAMFALLSDSEKRISMGIEAKQRFLNLFTLDRMIKDYMRLYSN